MTQFSKAKAQVWGNKGNPIPLVFSHLKFMGTSWLTGMSEKEDKDLLRIQMNTQHTSQLNLIQ